MGIVRMSHTERAHPSKRLAPRSWELARSDSGHACLTHYPDQSSAQALEHGERSEFAVVHGAPVLAVDRHRHEVAGSH
jgi:hypothetical protein